MGDMRYGIKWDPVPLVCQKMGDMRCNLELNMGPRTYGNLI